VVRGVSRFLFGAGWKGDLIAWLGLGLVTLIVLWPLGLTNRVLAGVDAFTYFLPYWAYRMAELRAGHLPLWNPYLFLGVPFLANAQAAVLYPLHWPLSWLAPERALIWSALGHIWLAAGLAYTFARRSLRLSRPAATVSALAFGLGGFTAGRIENINQLNTVAWLPAVLWLSDEVARAAEAQARVRWLGGLTLVIAVQLLAGHTQMAFISLVGLVLWRLVGLAVACAPYRRGVGEANQKGDERLGPGTSAWDAIRPARVVAAVARFLHRYGFHLLPLAAIIPACLLAAGQLLPTWELSRLGLRGEGLSYRQAVSFSLRPRLLAQSLLPPFAGGLAEAFGSEGYAEFMGYVGVAALVLAAAGVLKTLRPGHAGGIPKLTVFGLLTLASVGFLLALGGYNPFYYPLWRAVPGFASFRAPARWLALYALGVAGLAGVGVEVCLARNTQGDVLLRKPRRSGYVYVGILLLIALAAFQKWPAWPALAGWAAAGLLSAGLLWLGPRRPQLARAALLALVVAELWLAGRALPFARATAPLALSLRNAPAALLAATADQPPAGRDRFLSMSDIRFDPGDLAALRNLQADRLPAEAVERLVRAAKQMEVIAPNLSLLLRLPAVDGYDGGLVPTHLYRQLQSLFLPADQALPDGRLREQLEAVPPDRLLDLTGTRFVISDKQDDLWLDDIYYDLELPATLQPGTSLRLDLSGYPPFSATGLGAIWGLPAEVTAQSTLAHMVVSTLAGEEIALDVEGGPGCQPLENPFLRPLPGVTYNCLARLDFPAPLTPSAITVQVPARSGAFVVLRGLSLVDARTAAHASVTVSPAGNFRRIHTGDVKIYERLDAPGRAWLVHGVEPVTDDVAALARLADPAFDPRRIVIVAGQVTPQPAGEVQPGETVTVLAYEAEEVVLAVHLASPGYLVLADAFYPGWQATVDGQPAPILRANLMFRAVALEPGSHRVAFTYRPLSWRLGMGISLGTLLLGCALSLRKGVISLVYGRRGR